MAELPSGTVTFLFTDIEGSTTRWEHRPEAMRLALARHDALVRAAIHEHAGHVVKTMGDAFHAVFVRASDAVAAALIAQRRLQAEPWGEIGPIRVRMAAHTGAAEERGGDYYGTPVNRAARLMSAGHGGQVLLSQSTYELVRDAPPDEVTFVDLGEHRLKDLIRPERVFQLAGPGITSDFPLLASLDARPHNLPLQVTALLGREQDVRAVRNLVLRDDVRLVTLTGPGGTGKTRLGLQVAADLLEHFEDGAFVVDLAPISDPGLVLSTIAQALGMRDVGGRPVLDVIVGYLHGRRLLLLLDNFEQVLGAATVVTDLLRACAGLSVLVTSRAPLQIGGEREFPVPPLALPDPADLARPLTVERLSHYAAVALFIERAVAVKPDFTVTNQNAPAVAAICVRLDGLPLAVEPAAARTRLLSPDAILARLGHGLALLTGGRRDLPARQQTLRNAIAWSYDLLDPDEKRLFRQLGMFVGGFTLDAAESVCKVEGDLGIDVLDGLESLVSKSLVKLQAGATGESRFTMLETIREFGLEQLGAIEEASIRRRHFGWCLRLAEYAGERIDGMDSARWLDRLAAEHGNLRAALSRILAEPTDASARDGLRLAVALHVFWFQRDHLGEGRRWLERALTRVRPPEPESPGDTDEVAAHRSSWGASSRVAALNALAMLAYHQQELVQAEGYADEARELARIAGDARGLAHALSSLGNIVHTRGDRAPAVALFEESLALFREAGDAVGAWRAGTNLAEVVCILGDYERAQALLEECLTLANSLPYSWGIAQTLRHLGRTAYWRGDLDRASDLLEESLVRWREIGTTRGPHWSLSGLGSIALDRNDLDRATHRFLESLALCHEAGDRREIARCFEGLARIAIRLAENGPHGGAQRAATLLGAAEALREAIDSPLYPQERPAHEGAVSAAHAQLGGPTFAAAHAKGRTMSLEQATILASELECLVVAPDPDLLS
jgi:predicted ATPase/class 3 adenylate cyclase